MNSAYYNKTLSLFDGVIYKKITPYKTFLHLRSYFDKDSWNYIVPLVPLSSIDLIECDSVIAHEKSLNKNVLFYINQKLISESSKTLIELGFKKIDEDSYLIKNIDQMYTDINEDNFQLLSKSNINDQMALGELCFPEYNNREYVELFEYNHKQNVNDKFFYNVLRYNKGVAVAFGFVIVDPKLNLAYLHNAGTHPNYRRQGFFTEMVKYRCNLSLMNKVNTVFSIVESNGLSYSGLIKLGFTEFEKFYIYSR